MGDVLVLVFFGLVPVLGTYYLVALPGSTVFNLDVVVSAINCGLIIDLLLIVNNFRDIDNDKAAGKKTLVVYIGKKNTLFLYCGIGVAVLLLGGFVPYSFKPHGLSFTTIVFAFSYIYFS